MKTSGALLRVMYFATVPVANHTRTYQWCRIKNQRSLLVSRIRPCTLRAGRSTDVGVPNSPLKPTLRLE